MKTHLHTIDDIIDNNLDVPLDIGVIPNYMGINLCSVEAMSWTEQDDGQLVNLAIHFIPAMPDEREPSPPRTRAKRKAREKRRRASR
jgi:hypothetical protein